MALEDLDGITKIGDTLVVVTNHFRKRWEERVGGQLEVPAWAVSKLAKVLQKRKDDYKVRIRTKGERWILATKRNGALLLLTVFVGPWSKSGVEWISAT